MMNSKAHRIYLIGMMASGKSTVGESLAVRLGYTFVDMDAEIEVRQGKSISDIFADQGEAYFRKLESQLLLELSTRSKIVISTGGGAPIYHNGMHYMLNTGRVVWLKLSRDIIYKRLQDNSNRPLAQKLSKYQLSKMIRSRNKIYKQADIRVWNRGSVYDVVNRIANIVNRE